MLGEILLGVRPVLARMPEIPCVFWGAIFCDRYRFDYFRGLSYRLKLIFSKVKISRVMLNSLNKICYCLDILFFSSIELPEISFYICLWFYKQTIQQLVEI